MIRLPWKRKEVLCMHKHIVNIRLMEPETAKEILAEVFHAHASDVEEMIQRRLEEKSWPEDRLWPERFWEGE